MPYKEFHYRWKWDLKSSPDTIWPLIADTNRFNYDTGIPFVERVKNPTQPLSKGGQQLRLSLFGMNVEWEELPFEWVRPFRFAVIRRYVSGPIHVLRTRVELEPN